ncbi:putative C6 transcription factor [Hypomontagnella monticulosa]|nr:putative C6 transcription factor [Hypomontagnella monticulosa]
MPRFLTAKQPEADGATRGYSCLTCRQRKVKCDRLSPCCNCLKAKTECRFVPPVRGKRKRTKPPRESLHAKVRRYEDMLRAYGAKIEPSEDFDEPSSETVSPRDVEMIEDGDSRSTSQSDHFEPEAKFLTKRDRTRYFDSAPWSQLGSDEHPEVGSLDKPMNDLGLHELFFEPNCIHQVTDLVDLHPPLHIFPKLRDVYVNRVDPLVKILHVPTFEAMLLDGLRNQDLPKGLEAAAFAYYLSIVSALKEDECKDIFGEHRDSLHLRYKRAARRALVNAGFLSTSNLMTLRAYAIFLMCVRKDYGCDSLFTLSGIAIRLARKMGLHRDGTSLRLSLFETEMRRRLWWHLIYVDSRTAEVLGMNSSQDISGTTRMPLNADDEDLHPAMTQLPPERKGITSITLCLVRCEMMETSRKIEMDMRWESPEICPAESVELINQLESRLEERFLRYCDPSNPLHTFVSINVRSSICKMRIFAHKKPPPDNSCEKDREVVFTNAIKLLEYVSLVQGGHQGLERYKWAIGTSFLWSATLYVLIEARHRKTGAEVDKLWYLIGTIFSYFPQFNQPTNAVFTTLAKWTLKVFEAYTAASKAEGVKPVSPEFIHSLSTHEVPMVDVPPATHDVDFPNVEPFEDYNFPDLPSLDMNAHDWLSWEQFGAEQGVFSVVAP